MSKIRKSAKGRECTIRLPGICNFDPDKTVFAHIGRKRGTSIKCNDLHGIYACSDCHDVIDGRRPTSFTNFELDSYKLDALEETQLILLEEGLIHAP